MVSKELLIHGGSAYGIIKKTGYKTAFLVKHYFEKHYTHTHPGLVPTGSTEHC